MAPNAVIWLCLIIFLGNVATARCKKWYLDKCSVYGYCNPINSEGEKEGRVILRSNSYSTYSSVNVTATIRVPISYRIMIRVKKFSLPGTQGKCADYASVVRFTLGNNANTADLCGKHTYLPNLYSATNEIGLYVQMTGWINALWQPQEFELEFNAVKSYDVPLSLQSSCQSPPKKIDVQDEDKYGGQIMSHDTLLGTRFQPNLDCGVLLTGEEEGVGIEITISWLYNLDKDCTFLNDSSSFLAFYSGANSSSPRVKAYCSTSKSTTLIIDSQQVYMRFHTGPGNNITGFGGFMIKYSDYDPLSIGAIIGITVGCLAILVLLVGLCVCCITCSNKAASRKGHVIPAPSSGSGQTAAQGQFSYPRQGYPTNQSFAMHPLSAGQITIQQNSAGRGAANNRGGEIVISQQYTGQGGANSRDGQTGTSQPVMGQSVVTNQNGQIIVSQQYTGQDGATGRGGQTQTSMTSQTTGQGDATQQPHQDFQNLPPPPPYSMTTPNQPDMTTPNQPDIPMTQYQTNAYLGPQPTPSKDELYNQR